MKPDTEIQFRRALKRGIKHLDKNQLITFKQLYCSPRDLKTEVCDAIKTDKLRSASSYLTQVLNFNATRL